MAGELLLAMCVAVAAYWAWLCWRHPRRRDHGFQVRGGPAEDEGPGIRDLMLLSFGLGLCAAAAGVHFAPQLALVPPLRALPWAAFVCLGVVFPLLLWLLGFFGRMEEIKQLLEDCGNLSGAIEREAGREAKRRRDGGDLDGR